MPSTHGIVLLLCVGDRTLLCSWRRAPTRQGACSCCDNILTGHLRYRIQSSSKGKVKDSPFLFVILTCRRGRSCTFRVVWSKRCSICQARTQRDIKRQGIFDVGRGSGGRRWSAHWREWKCVSWGSECRGEGREKVYSSTESFRFFEHWSHKIERVEW